MNFIKNSSSCGEFLQLRKARFLDEPFVLSASLASHNCKNSSTILEFASCVESMKNAESGNKIKLKKPLKSFCYFWLLPKVESPLPLNSNLPNNADSADSQNLVGKSNKKSLLKFLLLFAFAKRRAPFTPTNSNLPNKANSQNLVGKSNKKSLLKFLLLFAFAKRRAPFTPTNSNLPNKANSQNLVKNQSREAQPLASSGQVLNGGKGVVAEGEGSDFAIRKNPCIQASAPSLKKTRVGEKGNQKQIYLRERECKEIDSANSQNLKGGLARRFCESTRNDEILDSSVALFPQDDKIKKIKNDKLITRVAESALDSVTPVLSTRKANSAIADEFLGFCETSDKDRTKVHRGSELKQSLKSRCESKFALKFDKDNFYFLLVALGSILSLIYLISGASISYKEATLLRENSATIAKIANFSLAYFSHILGLDFSAKLPNLAFHTLNLALIYLISNKILKFKRDSVLCVAVYALIPGVIMQGGIINESIIALFMVLVICYAELTKRCFIYPLCVLAVFLGESALMLFLALCFYFAIIKNIKSALFALLCLLANIYIYGIDISGAPKGNFLGVFSELALLYSPALFVYFIYAIYRNFAKGGANLLLYISGISLVTSVILSIRQDVDKEIYMFMSLCGIPLAIKQFLSGLRLRLPSFQHGYKRQFLIIAIILVFEAFLLVFSKQIYKVSNDENLFLNQFYIAKEVAFELKKRNISRVQIEGRMQERLAFYGIQNGGQKLRRVKKGGNIVVEYYGKVIARYAI